MIIWNFMAYLKIHKNSENRVNSNCSIESKLKCITKMIIHLLSHEPTKASIWKFFICISFYTNHIIITIFAKIITRTIILKYLGTIVKLRLHLSQKGLFSTYEIFLVHFEHDSQNQLFSVSTNMVFVSTEA